MNARAGAAEIDGDHADDEGDGRNNFKENQRLDGHAAHFAKFRMTGDANDESAKNERRDDDFDEAEKNGAEDLKVHGGRGGVVAQFDSGEEADDDPQR